jgi:hypothetical protein
MLKFITNLFGAKKAAPSAPYKVETPTHTVDGHGDVQSVVNPTNPVVNGKKKSAPTKTSNAVTGNTPAKKTAKKPTTKK